MTPETMVSLRIIKYYMLANGLTVSTVDRSTDLLKSVKDSQLKYLLFLEERSWASKAENTLKEMKKWDINWKMTYNKLETEAKHLKQYDKKSEKANSTGKMKGLR